ncbi:MAG: hypothetical protein WCG04_00440 [Alphaproteobacteria bacterium]
MKTEKTNAILAAANLAAAAAQTKIQPEVRPRKPKRVRFSGYFSDAENEALKTIRTAFAGDRLPDNVIVRAAVRAADPAALRSHFAAIFAEDRRLKD